MLLSRPIEPPDSRSRSPSGGSTLITSAPMSARCWVANGPSSTAVRSITFTPANGPGISFPRTIPGTTPEDVRGLHDERHAGHDGGEQHGVDQHALDVQAAKPSRRGGGARRLLGV